MFFAVLLCAAVGVVMSLALKGEWVSAVLFILVVLGVYLGFGYLRRNMHEDESK